MLGVREFLLDLVADIAIERSEAAELLNKALGLDGAAFARAMRHLRSAGSQARGGALVSARRPDLGARAARATD